MTSVGAKAWFTAAELAELALPGLPKAKRKINELALAERWAFRADAADRPLARARAGRGGGLEYHHALLPAAASLALAKKGLIGPCAPSLVQAETRDQCWTWFDGQPEASKAEAGRRLGVVEAVEALEIAGMTRSAAVAAVSAQRTVSGATVWNWLKLIAGVRKDDRLPALAPRRRGGGAEIDIHPQAWQAFRTDYLRPEKPTLAACYGRVERMAASNDWGALPHIKTLQRRLEKEVDPRAMILARNGVDELRRALPPQERSVAEIHALEHVNVDGHKWDVFVRWPDGRVGRPMMVAIQDIYSRKFLTWRVGESESAEDVRLAFADLFRLYGIPKVCTLDNGRAFASKWITGGVANRFRFKVQPGDPMGLLTLLGVQIHWTIPYRGQSKPIERGFRDFCGRIATCPEFAGAYTGNSPMAKPENYGKAAIPIEDFRRIVSREIAAHNAKEGRETEMARGVKSFDQVFQESYALHPVARATAEQLRLALLASEKIRADRKSGAIALYDNTFWAPEMIHFAGEQVVARFDPEALQTEVHVYDLDGRFLMTAPIWRKTGFLDVTAAKDRARLESTHKRHARRALEAENLLQIADLAALMPDAAEPNPMSPSVIRPVRMRGGAALAQVAVPEQRLPSVDRFLEGAARLRVVE